MAARNKTLFLFMNGERVGTLTQTLREGLALQYDSAWLASPNGRPVSLSLPFSTKKITGPRVTNFFDNLLPDNPEVRERLQGRLRIESREPFDMLYQLGRDCVGAIQLLPTAEIPQTAITAEPVSNVIIADTLRNLRSQPLGINRDREFRISLAGIQEKTAFLKLKGNWHRPTGSTPTTHIFKVAMQADTKANFENTIENEWLCSRVFNAFGLPAIHAEIAQFEDVKTLVIERFDRILPSDSSEILRKPQEDLCQALGYSASQKYEVYGGPGIKQIMKFLLGSQTATEDRIKFLKAQILFFMLAAIDGHAKNFSIFILPQGRYSLTPFYDIISAYPLLTEQFTKYDLKMSMALIGKNRHYEWEKIHRRHFFSTALACDISNEATMAVLTEIIDKTPKVIESVRGQLPRGFPERIAANILQGLMQTREILALPES